MTDPITPERLLELASDGRRHLPDNVMSARIHDELDDFVAWRREVRTALRAAADALARAEADSAALREALRWAPELSPRDSKGRAQLFIAWSEWKALKAALATDAGKALLERLRTAEEEVFELRCDLRDVNDNNAAQFERAEIAEARLAALKTAMAKSNEEICQTLGQALGYPWFKDDQKNFPGATEVNGVCVGDHVAESIATEAARRIGATEIRNAALLEALETACSDLEAIGINADHVRRAFFTTAGRGMLERLRRAEEERAEFRGGYLSLTIEMREQIARCNELQARLATAAADAQREALEEAARYIEKNWHIGDGGIRRALIDNKETADAS
jgi:hypothetical protein